MFGRPSSRRGIRPDGTFLLDGVPLIARVQHATRTVERMRGLLGHTKLPTGEGLWLDPCGSIHMVGMRFSIDVIFLDRRLRVVRVFQSVRPMGCAWGGRGAHSAIEVATGWLPLKKLSVGHELTWVS